MDPISGQAPMSTSFLWLDSSMSGNTHFSLSLSGLPQLVALVDPVQHVLGADHLDLVLERVCERLQHLAEDAAEADADALIGRHHKTRDRPCNRIDILVDICRMLQVIHVPGEADSEPPAPLPLLQAPDDHCQAGSNVGMSIPDCP